jgi:hypothetical protein
MTFVPAATDFRLIVVLVIKMTLPTRFVRRAAIWAALAPVVGIAVMNS